MKSSPGLESHPFRVRDSRYQGNSVVSRVCRSLNLEENVCPPKAFTFGRKNHPGVTSTLGPHKPRHHYKTQVPKVQNLMPEALRGQVPVPTEKNLTRECSTSRLATPGPATRARPFRSKPPSPGGRETDLASTRARGFAAYPRRCPLAQSGTGSSSDSPPSPAQQPEQA